MKTLYELLVDAGIPPAELDHHESDLYVLDTPAARRVIREYHAGTYPIGTALLTTFISQIDGRRWIDLPFRYAPFWDAVANKGAVKP